MAASTSDNEVVVALTLTGQADMLRGFQQASDAATQFADAVVAANDRIIASQADAASSMSAVATAAATATTDASASYEKMAAASSESADAVVANNLRVTESNDEVGASSKKAGSGVLGLLSSIRTLAIGASVYVAVRGFSQYQQNLTLLTTQAGLAANQLGAVKTAIDSISSSTMTGKNTLAQGFFNPISEGFGVQGAATIEKYAAELAQMSGASLTGTTGTSYAISTMLQTYGLKPTGGNVANITALLNAGVGAGDMHLQDLLGAASTGYFNVAKSYGISSQDAMGMLDFFTSQGVPAQDAATRARYFLALLASPSSTAQGYGMALGLTQTTVTGTEAELAALGLRPSKMATLLRGQNGIANAMQLINNATSNMSATDKEALMSKLFGGGRSDATALAIAAHVGLLTQFTNRVGEMSTPERFAKGWQTWEQTFHAQEQAFTTDISSMAIAIGQEWAPAVGALMGVLGPVAKFFADNRVAAEGLAAVLGGALFLTFTKLIATLGTQLVGAIAEGVGDLSKLASGIVNLGKAAFEAIAKVLGLAAAEAAEGDSAKKAIPGNVGNAAANTGGAVVSGAEDVGMAGSAALLGPGAAIVAGGTAAALAKKNYDESHPYSIGGPLWGTKPVMTPHGIVNEGPSPSQLLHDVLNFPSTVAGWMNHLAGGGTIGGGFATNRPTAIVGEGGPHPEYVIPTDPAYRSRALGLYASLGGHLMASGGTMNDPSSLMQLLALVTAVLPEMGGGFMGMGSSSGSFTGVGAAAQLAAQRSWMSALASSQSGLGTLLSGNAASAASTATSLGKLGKMGSPSQFAMALLQGLGDKATPADMAGLLWWEGKEGGNWNNSAAFNPLNTTERMPGSQVMPGGSSAGVQAYSSWGQGLQATLATLENGDYGPILSALKSGAGINASALYSSLHKWGTLAKGGVLRASSYDTGGYLPEGWSMAFNGTGQPEPVTPPGGFANTTLTVNLVVDGQTLAQTVIRNLQDRIARR